MNKKGFSLAEIIVSTIVMTMLMVSVIGYIQYSGEIWQDGYSKISGINYMRMTTEILRQDLLRAVTIASPSAVLGGNATPTAQLNYRISGLPGSFTIRIATDSDLLLRLSDGVAAMNNRIAKNVASFSVMRISTWTLQIHIQIHNDITEEDETYRIIASDTLSFMAPGAG
ncbi:MAG: hypothetical protein CVV42_03420 [Candidatus Riflebacteria bacterium HGW-Riflebacteria-2]|nr:MAG: hypothetical protein CVV42_03420 [Candidatus Riflebacteria bacterium HGW-Riflebacteria-2]